MLLIIMGLRKLKQTRLSDNMHSPKPEDNYCSCFQPSYTIVFVT